MTMALTPPLNVTLTTGGTWYEIDGASPGSWPLGKLDVSIGVLDSTLTTPQAFYVGFGTAAPTTGIQYIAAGNRWGVNSCSNVGYQGVMAKNNPYRIWVKCATAGAIATAYVAQESV